MKILVQVNKEQKEFAEIGAVKMFLANNYNVNYRERNPVIGVVVDGKGEIENGSFVVAHHNHFGEHSPYEYSDGLYAIPYNHNIFAVIDKDGEPHGVCNNIICERIEEDEIIGLANSKRTHFHDRITVLQGGFGYEKGEQILMLPFSDYECVYNFNGIEKRFIRVHADNIVAILKK